MLDLRELRNFQITKYNLYFQSIFNTDTTGRTYRGDCAAKLIQQEFHSFTFFYSPHVTHTHLGQR